MGESLRQARVSNLMLRTGAVALNMHHISRNSHIRHKELLISLYDFTDLTIWVPLGATGALGAFWGHRQEDVTSDMSRK